MAGPCNPNTYATRPDATLVANRSGRNPPRCPSRRPHKLRPRPDEHPGLGARQRPDRFARSPTPPNTPPATTAAGDPWFAPRAPRSRKTRRRTRPRPPQTRRAGVGLAHRIGVGVEQIRQIPATIAGKLPHRVVPPATKSHNAAAESTPPGNRHAIPTTATGSQPAPPPAWWRRPICRRPADWPGGGPARWGWGGRRSGLRAGSGRCVG